MRTNLCNLRVFHPLFKEWYSNTVDLLSQLYLHHYHYLSLLIPYLALIFMSSTPV